MYVMFNVTDVGEINELTTYNSSLKLNSRRRRRRKESVFAGKKNRAQ